MKKMNKKGFTLIELLAVIVILAIIALISTPIIIGVIDKARVKSAENSAYGIIDAARLAYTESIMSGSTITGGDVTSLKVSGDEPEEGTFLISTEDGSITINDVKIGEYTCSGTDKGVTCKK